MLHFTWRAGHDFHKVIRRLSPLELLHQVLNVAKAVCEREAQQDLTVLLKSHFLEVFIPEAEIIWWKILLKKKQLNHLLDTWWSRTRQCPLSVQLLQTSDTHSLEGLVCELLHVLAKQLLGSVAEHMMQVTSWPAPRVAQELVRAHAAKPAPACAYKWR